ncbi:MAG: hypothetical protein LBO05_09875 [Deltaproteobacteria bacterium]|jgi:hypothetical protein|nr:hypothetical protein [Deltaproteobacteria bacterium]
MPNKELKLVRRGTNRPTSEKYLDVRPEPARPPSFRTSSFRAPAPFPPPPGTPAPRAAG